MSVAWATRPRREWHGPTTCIRGCADIYFSRNYHRSALEHFGIMRPATLWQLQISSKSSRWGFGLQIPLIPVWLSILGPCQNKPIRWGPTVGALAQALQTWTQNLCGYPVVYGTSDTCDMEKVDDLLNVWTTCQCSCMRALHLSSIYFNTVRAPMWRGWHIKWCLKPISGCGSGW